MQQNRLISTEHLGIRFVQAKSWGLVGSEGDNAGVWEVRLGWGSRAWGQIHTGEVLGWGGPSGTCVLKTRISHSLPGTGVYSCSCVCACVNMITPANCRCMCWGQGEGWQLHAPHREIPASGDAAVYDHLEAAQQQRGKNGMGAESAECRATEQS